MKHLAIPGYTWEGMFGMDVEYLTYLSQFGAVHVLTPDDDVVNADLLVLPGGKDVSPDRYGERPGYRVSSSNPYFEHFDKVMLPAYIKAGIPVFGICRGLQALNVHFGGTLTQHLFEHPKSGERDELVHDVIRPGAKRSLQEVNSLHHQAIGTLGTGLEITLTDNAGVVEAIRHTALPIAAVQWHPEEINDAYARAEIERLLSVRE